jgi:hypothetical protein
VDAENDEKENVNDDDGADVEFVVPGSGAKNDGAVGGKENDNGTEDADGANDAAVAVSGLCVPAPGVKENVAVEGRVEEEEEEEERLLLLPWWAAVA